MVSPSPIQNPKSPIPRESFSKAIEALLQSIKSQPKHQKSQLFESDDVLYLIITLARIPADERTNPYRIPIPHTLHPFHMESTSICLILDDRPNSSLPPSTALEQIRSQNLPISLVIGLSDLKSNYQPYESRRKLCDSYDLFFGDENILPLLLSFLGKHFFRRKKIPLGVNFGRVGWVEQIKAWCESSLLYLKTGSSFGLKIGRVGMGKDMILENAEAVLEQVMEIVPKKWENLRSVHLKTVYSVALPLYQKVPEIGMRIEGVEDEKYAITKNEKKRTRDGEAKKGRIHDAGCLVEEEDVQGDAEVVKEEVALEDKVKDKKRKLNSKCKDEQGELMMNGVEEEENDELKVKKKKKKKKKNKTGKVKEVKESGDEEDGRELSELSEKKLKKQKKMKVNSVGPSEGVKTSKQKRKGEEVGDELRLKGKKKKVQKGGNTMEDVGEENRESDLSENKEVEENAVVGSDGKKNKAKKPKGNVVKNKNGKVRTSSD